MGEQRLLGVKDEHASWFAKAVFFFVKRRLGRDWEPLRVAAHNTPVLKAHVGFEQKIEAARSLPKKLKTLASLKASMEVGCPA